MTTVRIGGVHDLNTSDTDGIAYSIFFQGCNRCCEGCHNPALQSFHDGIEIEVATILASIEEHLHIYDAAAFLGGEPLEQPEALQELLIGVKALGLETWLYTGYQLDQVPSEIATYCDVIVAGEYDQELQTGGFPASSNQIVFDKRRKAA
ncbi:4Fe-4S single cluster domain-containing protein [Heliophilum fasciatum]|uniref:Anaerobic ribonucleoside-triphosphate reductase-activating protein n=1 Tax=Heliophilum fasciatum TaxID=35700 RepID=A0A4R2RIL9_9FIRM|nr:4Fe-4S single cluster domain-containing protein [Heliophilum fasciatum]MCW2278702.1 anaerobic ribonucleoside-triphosphate reductase activating protein [Heliophilum fasciatum]TCP62558.1 anaerobic ribonucleoside-triphosphate reductase activating protein [Heliophilum fasciatum]